MNILVEFRIIMFSIFLVIGLCCFLQAYLCKRDQRWLGFVLPSIHFINTLFLLLAMVGSLSFMEISGSTEVQIYEDGNSQQETMELGDLDTEISIKQTFILIFSFLLFNIPIGIYLLIYKMTRRKLSKFEELARMTAFNLD